MEFSEFCACGPSGYAALRQRVDLCARQGRSYEFAACRMPAGCRPEEADLGFWREGENYLCYLRPAVAYTGPDPRLAGFFDGSGLRRFRDFPALCRCLRALDAPPPRPPAPEGPPGAYRRLHGELRSAVLGQEEAVEAVAFKLYGHISKRSPARPLSLIFYGPTCVGKSELAKAVAPALDRLGGPRYQPVWTELNTFTEAHSVYRLTGAPPGYAGYDDPPVLEAVRRNPRTVFLFDELDKAHPEALKVFMSILDEGRCSARREDGEGGRELDFRQCVFLFTTNADLSGRGDRRLGFAPAPPAGTPEPPPDADGPAGLARRLFLRDEAARQAMVRAGVLREIAGRFSGLVGFRPLSEETRVAVTAKQIAALGREYGLEITGVDAAIARALTPRDALSPRSAVGVLEGVLTPLFLSQSSRAPAGGAFRLRGSLDGMCLESEE